MSSVTYCNELMLFKIYYPNGITDNHINLAKKRGWKLFVDGHEQIFGLLDAPECI